MKKFLCIVLSFIMLFSLSACSDKNDTVTSPDETAAQEESEGIFSSFTAETLDGESADQSIFEGKRVTMINIWATFCAPCIREMPDLQRLHEDYAEKGFQVVGIVCDVYDESGVEDAKDIEEATGVKYISLLPSASLNEAKLKNVTSVPETLFVNEKGELIAGPYIGSNSYEGWAAIIEDVLSE